MTRIYLVRHAPTPANLAGVYQGQSNVPAVPIEGLEKYAIAHLSPRLIYCSPLQRAHTAARALFPGETLIEDDRLMERALGDWEGLDHATVRRRWPEYGEASTDLSRTPPNGESLGDLVARVESFLRDLPRGRGDIYVVTHNGWIRVAQMLSGEVDPALVFAESVPFLMPINLPDQYS